MPIMIMKIKNAQTKQNLVLTMCILSCILTACSKPLPQDKINYVGHWVSADNRVSLSINPNGRIEYSNNQPQRQSSISAPIQSFDGHSFNAGFGPLSTEFKVSQAPSMDKQGNWFMVVENYTLTKSQK